MEAFHGPLMQGMIVQRIFQDSLPTIISGKIKKSVQYTIIHQNLDVI